MKKILFSLSCVIIPIYATAQTVVNFEWAKQIDGYAGAATGQAVVRDNSNNIYATGYFTGRVDFDQGPGIYNLTSAGGYNGYDIFIMKSDASGNFIWAKQIGGTSDDYVFSIAVDGSGNVYTTGAFQGTVDFDPGAGTFNLISAGSDIFISKLDASGNFAWAKKMGGASVDYGYSVTVDGPGNVYTTGYFEGTADFDPGAGTSNLISAGFRDIFISKLDGSGNFLWAKQLGGISFDNGYSIAVDASANVYTTGGFQGTVDFDPGAGTFNLTSTGSRAIFISKLDASGNFVWAKQLGGGYGNGTSIKVDGTGNVYTTGSFFGTVDFDPGAATFNFSSSGSYDDIFISKLDVSGNFVWAKQMGGTYYDMGNSIELDGSGNIYTTGQFYNTVDFDPGAGTFNLSTGGGYDIFISKLDVSGNFVWAKRMGTTTDEKGSSIAVDGSGSVYTTGYFYGTVDFDPGAGVFNLISYGSENRFFIQKLDGAGNFVWVKGAGSGTGAFANSIALDPSGNIYSTGYFFGTVDFDPGAGIFNLTNSEDAADVFVVKSDASGNFIWAKKIGGTLLDYAYSIASDGSGNIYITGSFQGTVDFDPGAGTFNLTSSGNSDIFISKLDASGNFIWAKQIGGTSDDIGYSIAVDASGNVYTTGYFQGTADFDPGAGISNMVSLGSFDIFISKLSTLGNFIWAKQMGGAFDDSGNSITLDGSGNVYTTGIFQGSADFDPGAATFNLTASTNDFFISKLDPSGNFIWAKQIGGSSNYSQKAKSIAVDGSGNVHTTGYFSGTVDFDPGVGTFSLTSTGFEDIFISKLDASGNFVWAKGIGGGSQPQFGNSVAVDGSGNVYTTGYFLGTVDFDPGAGTYTLQAIGKNIFISKLDDSGNFVWAKQLGGSKDDEGRCIVVDGSRNIFTGGIFRTIIDFDPGAGAYNVEAVGDPGAFIHKMSQCTLPSASITPAGSATFCSGANVILNANTGTGLTYQWKNNGTDISGAINSTYTATAAGSYTVVVTNPCGSATSSATTVTVNSLPSATITPAGPTTFCSGGSVVLNAPVAANRSYQWKKGANLISGATLSSYTATIGGKYKVIVTHTVSGCSKTTASATVVTVNAPPTATITPQGPTTFCAGGSVVLQANSGAGLTYKWKKGNGIIASATMQNYTATTAGTYKVIVTNSNTCSKTSAGITVSVPCKEEKTISQENNFDVKVYPNPSSGDFIFEISNVAEKKIALNIYDMIGKLVLSKVYSESQFTIRSPQLAPGIYSAEIICEENKRILKLVKGNSE